MIAGELEYLVSRYSDEDYDSFNLFKKRKPKTEEEKQAKKEKRQAFFGRVSTGVKEAGGVEGIVGTASNIIRYFNGSTDTGEYDYEVNMTRPGSEADSQSNKTSNGIPKGVWIIGGIAVLVLGGWALSNAIKKNETVTITPPTP